MEPRKLPFKVGQAAEARSFESGFRGAWFRCRIKKIGRSRGEISHALEYFDFPDEKIRWTQLYQKPKPPAKRHSKKCLMIRPAFPPVYRESEMPDLNTLTEVAVIVNDVWRKGDLIDWWTDGCYWSARITEVLGDGKARIELPPPPVGEGYSYEVLCKDLRPSLEFSPDVGWTVPIPQDKQNCRPCARLVKPANQVDISRNLLVNDVDEGSKDEATAGALLEHNASFSSRVSASSIPPLDRSEEAKQRLTPATCKEPHTLETNMGSNAMQADKGKSSCSDSVSTSHCRETTANNESLKKMKTNGGIPLNCSSSDTIDAPLLDLEELVNRVKWMKGILQFGTPLPNSRRPSWKFVEHLAQSFPK